MPMMIRAALVSIAIAMQGGAALAHALLVNAEPAVGSTVDNAPKQVVLRFSEGIEPLFSRLEVEDSAGRRVDEGAAHTAPGDAKRFAVGLKPLRPGAYKVIWHATSVDTHQTEGAFTFTVRPPT